MSSLLMGNIVSVPCFTLVVVTTPTGLSYYDQRSSDFQQKWCHVDSLKIISLRIFAKMIMVNMGTTLADPLFCMVFASFSLTLSRLKFSMKST